MALQPTPWARYRAGDLSGFSDGDPVTEWTDSAGGGGTLSFEGTTSSTSGLYRPGGFGSESRPYVEGFWDDGTGTHVDYRGTTSTPSSSGGVTLAVVFAGVNDPGFNSYVFIRAEEVASRDVTHWGDGDDPGYLEVSPGGDVYDSSVAVSGEHLTIASWGSSGAQAWVDGSKVFTDTSPVADIAITELWFELRNLVGDPIGRFAEALFFDQEFSDDDAAAVKEYVDCYYYGMNCPDLSIPNLRLTQRDDV